MFRKVLATVALVALMAAPAFGSAWYNSGNIVARDGNGRAIVNTFARADGDSVQFNYDTDGPAAEDTMSVTIVPAVVPGWLLLTFPEEANALTAHVRFREVQDGLTFSRDWGEWFIKYIGGAERSFAFNVGLWDSCEVHVVGSAAGVMDAYWYVEGIGD